jgi:aarF domain-containing kinase
VAATADGINRFVTAGSQGALAAYEYKFVSGAAEKAHGKDSQQYKEAKKKTDKRAAERMLWVAKRLGGMYTKIGQYLSTLTHALPPEWTETLSELQDKASFRPWSEVAEVFEEDLGRPASTVFRSIEEQPVAAASLAQVHRAVTLGGQEVAVKIQYPELRRTATADLAALHVFFSVLGTLFTDFDYVWLFPEFRTSVNNELNFLQEAHNAERVKAMFASDPSVHIPAIYGDLSSSRVITMEFIRGFKANDVATMKKMGIDPRQIAAAVSRFFGDQVHVHGFVHCDPHAGNMLVRRSPTTGQPQLVVLDHGMYRRLTPTFRAGYCRLWQALVMRDDELGLQACRELGLDDDSYDVLSLMLLQRTGKSKSRLGARLSKEDIAKLKEQYKDVTAGDINRFMQKLPRDLLFVSRNTNMVRGLNVALGGTARERFRITGACAVRGLVLTDSVAAGGGGGGGAKSRCKAPTSQVPKHKGDENAQLVSDIAVPGIDVVAGAPADAKGVAWLGAQLRAVGQALGLGGGDELGHAASSSSSSSSSSSFFSSSSTSSSSLPLTYERALREGKVKTEPTESEMMQKQRRRKPGGRENSMTAHEAPSLSRKIVLAWRIAKLEWTLWAADAAFAVVSWYYGGIQDQMAMAGAGADGRPAFVDSGGKV